MEIAGSGFLAGRLRAIADRHPGTVALAAGVSGTSGSPDAAFAREAALVREVVDRCRRTGRRVLFFSTASASLYRADRPGREDDPVVPRNPYGAHKLGLEIWLRGSGAGHLVLRLGHVVGRGQPPHQLVPTLARLLRTGTMTVHRGATRDLIGVHDLVTVVDALLGMGIWGQTVNVASGFAIPVEQIVDHLERRTGTSARREYLDGGAAHLVSVEKLRRWYPR